MKTGRLLGILFGFIAVLLVGGFIALASSSVMPHTQTVEKQIPDDRIPH